MPTRSLCRMGKTKLSFQHNILLVNTEFLELEVRWRSCYNPKGSAADKERAIGLGVGYNGLAALRCMAGLKC